MGVKGDEWWGGEERERYGILFGNDVALSLRGKIYDFNNSIDDTKIHSRCRILRTFHK